MRPTILFILFSLLLKGCASKPIGDLSERTQILMGTNVSVALPPEASHLFKPAFELFKDIENKLSTYEANSEISKLNKLRQTNVSPVTATVLLESIKWFKQTNGYFHPGLGPWTKKFRFPPNDPGNKKELPPQKPSKGPAPFPDALKILNNKAFLTDAKTEIDLGGIGKGFAVDQVSDLLKSEKVKNFSIKASGDIRCRQTCTFYIQDPFNPENLLGPYISQIEDLSISTSGNYERYLGDKSVNHLIVPSTGESQSKVAGVTVFKANDNTGADALATAAAVMPLEKAKALLSKHQCEYIFLMNDGSIERSTGLGKLVKPLP